MTGEIYSKVEVSDAMEGESKPYVSLKRCRMLRSGVQIYGRDEIPAELLDKLPKKDFYKVFRKPEAVVKHLNDFNYLYFTDGHPKDDSGRSVSVTPENASRYAAGRIGGRAELKTLDDGNVYVENDVVFDSKAAYQDYLDGKVEMSIGMTATFEVSDNSQYDLVVTELSDVNHCALVPAGRAGHDAKIIDSGGKNMNGLFSFFKARKDASEEKKKVFDSISALCEKVADSGDEELKKIASDLADAAAGFDFEKPDKKDDPKKEEEKKEQKEADSASEEKKEVCEKPADKKADECSKEKSDCCEASPLSSEKLADEIRKIVNETVAKAVSDALAKGVKGEVEKSVKDALGVKAEKKVGDSAEYNPIDFDLPDVWGGR